MNLTREKGDALEFPQKRKKRKEMDRKLFYGKVIEAATAKGYGTRQNKKDIGLYFDNLKNTHIGLDVTKKGVRIGMWVGGKSRREVFTAEVEKNKAEVEKALGCPTILRKAVNRVVVVPVDESDMDKAVETAVGMVEKVEAAFKPYIVK